MLFSERRVAAEKPQASPLALFQAVPPSHEACSQRVTFLQSFRFSSSPSLSCFLFLSRLSLFILPADICRLSSKTVQADLRELMALLRPYGCPWHAFHIAVSAVSWRAAVPPRWRAEKVKLQEIGDEVSWPCFDGTGALRNGSAALRPSTPVWRLKSISASPREPWSGPQEFSR